jgi:hypothetical protein
MAIEGEKFQPPAVAPRPILLSALAALILLAAAIGGLQAVYYWQVRVQTFPAPEQFPEPRVQTGQSEQLRRIQAEQMSRLQGYHWVDQKQGLVQIPIERAMSLLVAEGAQAYAPLAPPQALSTPSAGAERLMTPDGGGPPSTAPAAATAGPPSPPGTSQGQRP